MKPEQLEIDRLRKEVARLKAERDILKSRGLLRQGPDVIFGFVATCLDGKGQWQPILRG